MADGCTIASSLTGRRRPELLAAAGDWAALRAAVANGADAVYCGLQDFNARLRAANFAAEELLETISEPTRAATPAIVAAGKEGGPFARQSGLRSPRRREEAMQRRASFAKLRTGDERRGLRPEVAPSLRVAASAGRLPRCVSSAMPSVASPAPLMPATQPAWVLR